MSYEDIKRFENDDEILDQILQDSLFLEERRSQGYIELMTHVQRALENVPTSKVRGDLRDLVSRRGSLVYFQVEGVEKEIPYDILYAPKLKHGIRDKLIGELEAHKSRLTLSHRRLLSRLQRIHRLDTLVDNTSFDVRHKTDMTVAEIQRFMQVAKRAHGARKMDALMEALLIPGRTYFDLVLSLQSLKDQAHPRHKEAMIWLNKSKYYGKVEAFEAVVQDAFRRLTETVQQVYDEVEELTGLKFSRNLENIDTESSWFGLGPVETEAQTIQDEAGREMRQRLNHNRFQVMKREWSMAYFEDREQKILEWAGDDPQRQAAGLSRMFFELQKKVVDSPKPQGSINMAIENDFNLGLVSKLEHDDAKAWVLENWKSLVNYTDGLIGRFEGLRENHPEVVLPEALEKDLEKLDRVNEQNKATIRKELRQRFAEVDAEPLEEELDEVEIGNPTDADTLRTLFQMHTRIDESLERVSPGNVPFLRQLRMAFDDRNEFEKQVSDLYQRQDEVERIKLEIEQLIFKAYRRLDNFSSLNEEELARCRELTVRNMFTNLSNSIYSGIDMETTDSMRLEAEALRDPGETFLRLESLLLETQSVPEANYLLETLNTWQNQSPDARETRTTFIMENEEKRKDMLDKLKQDLKDRLGQSMRETRLARFEIFGLNECLAESLERTLKILSEEMPRISAIEDAGRIAEDVAALEERVIEAQELSRKGSDFTKRIDHMADMGEIDPNMAATLHQDLEDNYKNLEKIMGKAGAAMKRAREQQIRFGLKRDVRYLDMTLNLPDLEELKKEYGFLETLSLEDLKRYCLSYRMAMDMMGDLLRKLEADDPDVEPEIRKQYTRRVRKNFLTHHFSSNKKARGREMTAVLKAAILRYNASIFEAETQRLIYFLNYADPKLVRSKDTYRNYLLLFRLAEDGDVKINRWLKKIITNLRGALFRYKPVGYGANYEQNRRAFASDLDELRANLEWY